MAKNNFPKIKSLPELYDLLPSEERILLDILRELVLDHLPAYGGEKISYNVPYFFGKKGICLIWPSTVPRGGIKSGVLFAFWYGNRLIDEDNYLERGTNKQIFYKVFQNLSDIDIPSLSKLITEAIELDKSW